MRHERSGIALLLGLLLILSSLLGALHAEKLDSSFSIPPLSSPPQQEKLLTVTNDITGLSFLTPTEILNKLRSLANSRSIEAIVELLRDLPIDTMRLVLKDLFASNVLFKSDFLQILFGAALYYKDDQQAQNKLFSIITEYKKLQQGKPLLLTAAKGSYPNIIESLLRWTKEQKNIPSLQDDDYRSFAQAIKENNVQALQLLDKHGILLDPSKISKLLWLTVTTKRRPDSARFLLEHGADINYSDDGTYTVLMRAVMNNDPAMVRLLASNKKIKINAILKNDVGSALQLIMGMMLKEHGQPTSNKQKKRYGKMHEIAKILRQYGAEA